MIWSWADDQASVRAMPETARFPCFLRASTPRRAPGGPGRAREQSRSAQWHTPIYPQRPPRPRRFPEPRAVARRSFSLPPPPARSQSPNFAQRGVVPACSSPPRLQAPPPSPVPPAAAFAPR